MQCPVCKTNRCTVGELDNHLRATTCETCGGHWISHKEYTKWLAQCEQVRAADSFSDVEFDAKDVHDAKLCPECGKILLKYKVGHGLDFFVDHCSGCGGIWLDGNEWDVLQGHNLHDQILNIFSTSWQSQVRGEQMAKRLDEVYANRLGEEAYEKAKTFRQWLKHHPQRQAVLAFLTDTDPYKI